MYSSLLNLAFSKDQQQILDTQHLLTLLQEKKRKIDVDCIAGSRT